MNELYYGVEYFLGFVEKNDKHCVEEKIKLR
jgi:hypothetical protein